MIVLAILLVISVVIIAYFTYHVRRLKLSSTKANLKKTNDNSRDVDEIPNPGQGTNVDMNYEQVDNEQSTYTALKRLGKDEDEHAYGHLSEVAEGCENQEEIRV